MEAHEINVLSEVANLNFIEDILSIIKEDNRHTIKICIDTLGITVYLDDDPEDTYEEKYIVPVRYDTLYECAYIPHDEYIKCMNDDAECGIDKEEIDLIQKSMEYLEHNAADIKQCCDLLNRDTRERINS